MSSANINTITLERLLPPNLATLPDAQLIMRAIDPEFQDLVGRMIECSLWPRIDDLDEAILDLLADQYRLLDLEGWRVASVARKRAMLKEIFLIYRCKGTPWSIERVLLLLDLVGEVEEWFDHGLDPFLWDILLDVQSAGVTQATLRQLYQLIEVTRPKRSPLRRLKLRITETAPLYFSGVIQGGTLTTLVKDVANSGGY